VTDDLRSLNQQRIHALRDQVTARREDHHEDTADELIHTGKRPPKRTTAATMTNNSTRTPTSTPASTTDHVPSHLSASGNAGRHRAPDQEPA
jgi:hypothetical protein